MKFDASTYKFLKTVNFSGYTFSFAAVDNGSYDNIFYTFCDTDTQDEESEASSTEAEKEQGLAGQSKRESGTERAAREEDEKATAEGQTRTNTINSSWTPPLALQFPNELRPVGMSLLTETVQEVPAAQLPFEIICDNINLWVIRRANNNLTSLFTTKVTSLLVDRFIFDTGAKRLVKANEVRFVRSGHPDLPASDRDSYGSADLNGEPFVEPTFCLNFDLQGEDATQDSVAALLIPDSSNSKRARWHFFITASSGELLHYTVPYTEYAWFDLTGMKLNQVSDSGVIAPLDSLRANEQNLSYPTASLYEQQETTFTQIGEPQRVKRAVRAMLACHAENSNDSSCFLAAFDFSIGLDGHLAAIPTSLNIPQIEDYNVVLKLDGRGDYVTNNAAFLPAMQSCFASCWLRWDGPNSANTPQTAFYFASSTDCFFIEIDSQGFVHLKNDTEDNAQSLLTSNFPLIPRQWANISLSGTQTSGPVPVYLWINGYISCHSVTTLSPLNSLRTLYLGLSWSLSNNKSQNFFNGAYGQFYFRNCYLNENNITTHIYNVAPSSLPPDDLVLFWSFGEGSGSVVYDYTQKQNPIAGNINGAIWEADVCPDQPSMPTVAIDEDFLDIRAILFNPSTSGNSPAIPAAGSAPSLMMSSDGLLHLYYRNQSNDQSKSNKAAVLHMSTSAERARFVFLQQQSGQTGPSMVMMLTFVARTTGMASGAISIMFGNIINDKYDFVRFEGLNFNINGDVINIQETWNNVPIRLDEFVQVINGQAAVPDAGQNAPPTYTPVYQINCGGAAAAPFVAEEYGAANGGVSHYGSASTIKTIDISGVIDPAPMSVYQDAAINYGSVMFSLPNLLPDSEYKVRLHFAETEESNSIGSRVFDVKINNTIQYHQLDIVDIAEGTLKAIVEEFSVTSDHNGIITIEAVNGTGPSGQTEIYPIINGIEILSLSEIATATSTSSQVEAAWGQVVYDYAANVTVQVGTKTIHPQANRPFASELFEAVANKTLLEQNPVPSLQLQFTSTLAAFAGRDCGWVMAPLQPCMKCTGNSGHIASVATAPALDIPGDLTIQAWIHQLPDSSYSGTLATFVGDNSSYQLGFSGNGNLVAKRFFDGDNGNYCGISRTSATILNPAQHEQWTHVAAAYRASYALHLPSNVYLDCGHGENTELTDGLTIEAWVKFDHNHAADAVLVSKSSYEAGQSSYELSVQTTGGSNDRQLTLKLWLDDGTLFSAQDSFTCTSNQWYHLAATYHPDSSFNYLKFNQADNNYVELDSLTEAVFTTFTVEMFIAPFNNKDQQSFLSIDRETGAGAYDYFDIGYNNNDSAKTLTITVEGQLIKLSSDSWTTTNQWQFLSVVVETDGTGTYLTVYVNGTIAEYTPGSSSKLHPLGHVKMPVQLNPNGSTFYPWLIGADQDKDNDSPDGFMDAGLAEVRIWSTARSASEILSTLFMPLNGNEPGLEALLLFNYAPDSGEKAVPNRVTSATCSINDKGAHTHDGITTDTYKPDWKSHTITGKARLYLNGSHHAHTSTPSQGANKTVRSTSTPLALGRQSVVLSGDARHFDGTLDNVRLWRKPLYPSQLAYFSLSPLPDPAKQISLAAFWAFNEGHGDRVRDVAGDSTAKIVGMRFAKTSDADVFWVPSPFDADWTLYVDGQQVDCAAREILGKTTIPDHFSGLVIGAEKKSSYSKAYSGFLSELQIWSLFRSSEDILRSINQPAVPPEDGLAGYYRLNDGSGSRAADTSGNAADAAIGLASSGVTTTAAWSAAYNTDGGPSSPVPVRDEAPFIVVTSNNYCSTEAANLTITSSPSVVEDRQSQGRIYTFLTPDTSPLVDNQGSMLLEMGTPLAKTELVYLGQIQYKPRLIGFIEGAPPVPSENLTIDSPSTPDRYVNNASVQLNRTASVKATASSGLDLNFGYSIGASAAILFQGGSDFSIGSSVGTPISISMGISVPIVSGEADIGITANHASNGSFSYSQNVDFEDTSSKSYIISFCGGWENNCYKIPGDISNAYQIAGQRLYRSNNMGSAIVKSRTADLYAVRSKKTKAMVGYRVVPNPEIPEDVNILMFKLNPKYVKNGTLDGYIGFDKDIDYKELNNGQKGSYFKPEEAYRLKNTIERQAKRAASDLSQYSSSYDKSTRLSLANTYVWVADGGALALESQIAASYQESFSGAFNSVIEGGVTTNFDFATGFGVLGGMKGSLDVLGNFNLNLNYSHSDGKSMAVDLNSNVVGEGFLTRVLVPVSWTPSTIGDLQTYTTELNSGKIDTTDQNATSLNGLFLAQGISLTAMNYVTTVNATQWTLVDLYTRYTITTTSTSITFTYLPLSNSQGQYNVSYDFASPNCPGKVYTYRFMSFYLAPDKSNFKAFFASGQDQIIDPNWLASADPNAVALRQAAANENEVWRVLHRVTYVNRVPLAPQDMWTGDVDKIPKTTQDVANRPVRPDDHSIRHNSILIRQVVLTACPQYVDYAANLKFNLIAGVDIGRIENAINNILDAMQITNSTIRRLYFDEMLTFFEMLFASDERPEAEM